MKTHLNWLRLIGAVLGVSLLLLAGCGDDDNKPSGSSGITNEQIGGQVFSTVNQVLFQGMFQAMSSPSGQAILPGPGGGQAVVKINLTAPKPVQTNGFTFDIEFNGYTTQEGLVLDGDATGNMTSDETENSTYSMKGTVNTSGLSKNKVEFDITISGEDVSGTVKIDGKSYDIEELMSESNEVLLG